MYINRYRMRRCDTELQTFMPHYSLKNNIFYSYHRYHVKWRHTTKQKAFTKYMTVTTTPWFKCQWCGDVTTHLLFNNCIITHLYQDLCHYRIYSVIYAHYKSRNTYYYVYHVGTFISDISKYFDRKLFETSHCVKRRHISLEEKLD